MRGAAKLAKRAVKYATTLLIVDCLASLVYVAATGWAAYAFAYAFAASSFTIGVGVAFIGVLIELSSLPSTQKAWELISGRKSGWSRAKWEREKELSDAVTLCGLIIIAVSLAVMRMLL